MICPTCQTANRQQALFCKECGRLLSSDCPNCGAALPEAAKYCDMCGHNLSSPLYLRGVKQEAARSLAASTAGSQSPQSQLQQYVPRELLSKLSTAQSDGGMVGERRIVTMLFCDVKDSTSAAEQLDPEEWSEVINGAFEHMIAPIYRYEGIVARLMGDGILAFFGAPIAHEDDPVRALLAGLEIVSGSEVYRRQVRQRHGIDIDVRIGINTGRVVVGAVGSDLRLEYTALGDAINVAARMEQTAEAGTVQIAEDTYRLVAPLFEFEDLGEVTVKGKREPVSAYRVLGRKAEPGQLRGIAGLESGLIGRQAELSGLVNALDALCGGRGGIVFLFGQAGLGKTRLMRDMYAHWQKEGSGTNSPQFWIHQPVASYQASEAYWVLKNQIRLMYGIDDGASPAEINAKLKQNVDALPLDEKFGTYEALARILGILEEGTAGPAVDGETFKRQLFAAVLGAIKVQVGQKPAVLVLDDLHWADPASVEVIEQLFELVRTVPILFLCAARPDRSAASWQLKEVAGERYPDHCQETVLQPLSETDSQAMLDGLLSGMDWPARLRTLILEKAEGNPFFIEEVVRQLIDRGVVQRNEDGSWHTAARLDDFVVPGSLQALLAARIDRLSEADRQVLQTASVIGRSFSREVLEKINEHDADVARSIESLARADLIEEEAGAAGQSFRFRNTLAQETVYRSILRRTRRDYHRRVGEALLDLVGGAAAEQLPALSHHFYQAQDARALSFNRQAGDEAYALYAYKEAAAYYGRAIEMMQLGDTLNEEEMTTLYRRRGRSLEHSAAFGEALVNYREMEAAARERENRTMELAALVSAGTVYSTANDQYNAAKAETVAEQALALARELNDEASEAKIRWNLLNMYRLSERPSLALASGERSLELARKNDLREQLAYTANDMAHVYMSAGLPDKARQTVNEALPLWRELGNQPMLADSLATAALYSSLSGDYEETIALSDEAFRISERIKNAWGQSYSRFAVGQFHWQRGEPGKAVETMKECIRLGEQAGFLAAPLYVGPTLALVYANLGAFDKALPLARRAVSDTRASMAYYEPVALSAMGQVLLLAGEIDQANGVFEELASIGTHLEPLLEAIIEEGKCRLFLAQKEYGKAIESARNLLEVSRKINSRPLLPVAFHLQAQAFLGDGQLSLVSDMLAQALSESKKMELRWPLWQILVTSAVMAEASGRVQEAADYRKRARQIFEDIAGKIPSADIREAFLAHPQWAKLWAG